MSTFTGWLVRKTDDGLSATLEDLDEQLLADGEEGQAGDTTIAVHHSSVNYKDALALQGRPGVTRRHPLVPGIDLVGEVVSSSGGWQPGDVVTLNGAGLGEQRHGGLAQRALVRGQDCISVPDAFTPAQAAAIGTAGFTAALSVLALERAGVTPEAGPVLVTGAGGGVGSVAVALLAGSGYEPLAVTGRPEALRDQLTALGAAGIVDRAELETPGRPLAKQRWGAVVDAVGGQILAGALAGLHNGGVATACGLAAGPEFAGNVMPFILRGVSLLGIDSVRVSYDLREAAWQRLAAGLDPALLDSVTSSVPLAQAQDVAARILAGEGTGRTVVDVR